jgi:hypothetical protein
VRKAKAILRKRLGDDRMKNIAFLMDFEGSTDAGDIEDMGPPPDNDAA